MTPVDPATVSPMLSRAAACVGDGRLAEAEEICRAILATNPRVPPANFLLARIALLRGDSASAIGLLDDVARDDPAVVRLPMFHQLLGSALAGEGMTERASEAFRHAIRLAPTVPQPYEELATLLLAEHRRSEAIATLRAAAEIAPCRTVFRRLAMLLSEDGMHEESVELDRKAVAIEPRFARSHEMLGAGLQVLGRFDEALECYRHAAALDPNLAGPMYRITRIKKITEDDRDVVGRLEAVTARQDAPPEELRLAHYGLGKAFEDLGKFEEAARHYRSANEFSSKIQHGGRKFDTVEHARWVDRLIETFGPALFESGSGFGIDSEAPIFVIGMIRSGTTLVEQILSSHPQVLGAGEIGFWTSRRATELTQEILGGTIDAVRIRRSASDYLSQVLPVGETYLRVTDKMPLNYLAVGLIHLALPRARFIHCTRSAIDTCLSIYTTPFPAGAEFCYDPQATLAVYREYRRLMEHWRRVLPPETMTDVAYEDLVSNTESVTRRLVEFCGLAWDDACLRHERNTRGVLTPSNWQARQAIYSSSVGRWSHFAPWLPEFAELSE